MDFAIDVLNDLEITHIFVHADEKVYANLIQLIWKYPDLYNQITPLMGGFHSLKVKLRLLHKRFELRGMTQWWSKANIIAKGSAQQAAEGKHYYRGMRCYKETFCALTHFPFEKLVNEGKLGVGSDSIKLFTDLREPPSYSTLTALINSTNFNYIWKEILHVGTGSEYRLTVEFLKNISSTLSMIAAVRDFSLDLHLQAQRDSLILIFAFDHVHYSRYQAYEHVFLRCLQQRNPAAYNELKEKGIGASLSGNNFSSIHGDLVTEIMNRDVKCGGGCFRGGYSTSTEAVNIFVKNAHIHAEVKAVFRKKLNIKTSIVHKELTTGAKLTFESHVKSLKNELERYSVDPFLHGPARHWISGVEIDSRLIEGILNAKEVGNGQFVAFCEERLKEGSKNIYDPIKKDKIDTGLPNMKKKEKKERNLRFKGESSSFW